MSRSFIRHCAKITLRSEYRSHQRDLARLRKTPRFTPTYAMLNGRRLELVDSLSYLVTFPEIFERQIYRFEPSSRSPLIIDGGANIGLSVLFFQRTYPTSRIVAFEPDQAIYNVLERNCRTFQCDNVQLVNKALWVSETAQGFIPEGSEAGRIARAGDPQSALFVGACRLRDYLKEPVDLLKLDIEGAEAEVIRDCEDCLHNVKHIFVESHSFTDEPQTFGEIVNILSHSGFRVFVHAPLTPMPQPFLGRQVALRMDFHANIFGIRT